MEQRLKALKFNLSETSDLNIGDIINSYVLGLVKKQDEIFETAVRVMAEPPIKGKITKGKVSWRGIKLIQQNDLFKTTTWLEQRGKQISPKFILEPHNIKLK